MDDPRKPTSTSAFGASRRESHDSSAFYARFTPPDISSDESVVAPADRPIQDVLFAGLAEHTLADESAVRDNSVALVVTSPPYFVGKSYEEAMGQGHIPPSTRNIWPACIGCSSCVCASSSPAAA